MGPVRHATLVEAQLAYCEFLRELWAFEITAVLRNSKPLRLQMRLDIMGLMRDLPIRATPKHKAAKGFFHGGPWDVLGAPIGET